MAERERERNEREETARVIVQVDPVVIQFARLLREFRGGARVIFERFQI